jgi:Tfp pilus assembly protein PilF
MLAMLFQQQGDDKEAIESYEKALNVQADNAVVMNNLAWLYHQASDSRATELARKAYEKARSRPEIIDTYGWILFENGQHVEALPVLQEALLKSPSHPEIGYHVAVALRKVNRAKEAEPILRRIVRNSPTSPFADKARQLLGQ